MHACAHTLILCLLSLVRVRHPITILHNADKRIVNAMKVLSTNDFGSVSDSLGRLVAGSQCVASIIDNRTHEYKQPFLVLCQSFPMRAITLVISRSAGPVGMEVGYHSYSGLITLQLSRH